MKSRVFLAAVFLTLLVFAHASDEESLLNWVQDYMQGATRHAQEALSTVQGFQVTQQTKEWMTLLQDYWNNLPYKFSDLWENASKPVEEVPPTDI